MSYLTDALVDGQPWARLYLARFPSCAGQRDGRFRRGHILQFDFARDESALHVSVGSVVVNEPATLVTQLSPGGSIVWTETIGSTQDSQGLWFDLPEEICASSFELRLATTVKARNRQVTDFSARPDCAPARLHRKPSHIRPVGDARPRGEWSVATLRQSAGYAAAYDLPQRGVAAIGEMDAVGAKYPVGQSLERLEASHRTAPAARAACRVSATYC